MSRGVPFFLSSLVFPALLLALPAAAQESRWRELQRQAFDAYLRNADHTSAIRLYAEALVIAEQTFGPESPNVAETLDGMALVERNLGRLQVAAELYARSLVLYEGAREPRHEDVADALASLGDTYRELGRHDEAEALQRRALGLREQLHGPEHAQVGYALDRLALVLHAQGRSREAEATYRRALAVLERTPHADAFGVLVHLSAFYIDAQRFGDAEPVQVRANAIVAGRPLASGRPNPVLALGLDRMGVIQVGLDRLDSALALFNEALRVLPHEHAWAADILEHRAEVLRRAGRAEEADHDQVRAGVIRARARLKVLNAHARAWAHDNNHAEAVRIAEEAARVAETGLGPETREYGTALRQVGELHRAAGRLTEAEQAYRRALPILEEQFRLTPDEVVPVLTAVAEIAIAQRRPGDAEPLYRRIIGIHERPGGHFGDLIRAVETLADLHVAQGHHAQAQPLYERALSMKERSWGRDHPDLVGTLDRLAAVLRQVNREGDARRLEARAARIRARQHR